MIFAVVGTQLPFPRLFDALEPIVRRHALEVVAQTGEPDRTSDAMQCEARIPPARFDALIRECRVVVGHAGIGVIIAAATHGKPLVLMPRRAALGEHRNDHQLATAHHFADRVGITIVNDAEALEAALLRDSAPPLRFENSGPRQALIDTLRGVIGA